MEGVSIEWHIACTCATRGVAWPAVVLLRYCDRSPLEVTVAVPYPQTEWVFGRDLLRAGLSTPSGEGDVRVAPDHDQASFTVELRSPGSMLALHLPTAPVEEFLRASAQAVPFGEEQVVVPDTLAGLS